MFASKAAARTRYSAAVHGADVAARRDSAQPTEGGATGAFSGGIRSLGLGYRVAGNGGQAAPLRRTRMIRASVAGRTSTAAETSRTSRQRRRRRRRRHSRS